MITMSERVETAFSPTLTFRRRKEGSFWPDLVKDWTTIGQIAREAFGPNHGSYLKDEAELEAFMTKATEHGFSTTVLHESENRVLR